VRLRLDAACDADGRVALLQAVPVWDSPRYGTVLGQEVWAAAARQGCSAELQRWLLHRATAAVARLDDDGVGAVVSLPAGHLSPDGLAGEVHAALAAAELFPSRLTLSLTEETLLTSTASLVPELESIRATGVRLCLDNYGMGHSLFALLARVPLDMVRVDVTTLAVRDDTERALRVLGAIARTTASFGVLTVAGAISTPELWSAAVEAGADLLQGRAGPHDLSEETVPAMLGAAVLPTL
jgi:EAL domain-containing protein (putative c-di-GMP-specific phosphodiesterase class I)